MIKDTRYMLGEGRWGDFFVEVRYKEIPTRKSATALQVCNLIAKS